MASISSSHTYENLSSKRHVFHPQLNNMPDHGSYHLENCGRVINQGDIEVIMAGGHETGGGGELNRVIAFTWSTQTWRNLPTVCIKHNL